jgi:surface antigen
MRLNIGLSLAALFLCAPALQAIPVDGPVAVRQHWECVPVARMLSGIDIYGNALSWWDQAEGRYRRGNSPRRGAVLAFLPHGSMTLGHVATVSRVIDDRTILVTHSNWSPINGMRGQIERDVQVIDVSEDGDWSRVRVWYAPSQGLGTTTWPVHGFIYPDGKAPMRLPDTNGSPAFVPKVSPLTTPQPAGAEARPTGRIAYLGKLLPKLR